MDLTINWSILFRKSLVIIARSIRRMDWRWGKLRNDIISEYIILGATKLPNFSCNAEFLRDLCRLLFCEEND